MTLPVRWRRDREVWLHQQLVHSGALEDRSTEEIMATLLPMCRREQRLHRRPNLGELAHIAFGQNDQAEQLELREVCDHGRIPSRP